MIAAFFPGEWGQWASGLADHLWQSTLFAVVVSLLTLALKKNRARVRYCLWFAASSKFLVPFSLLVVLGSHMTWLRPAAQKQNVDANASTVMVMEEVSQPFTLDSAPMVTRPRLQWRHPR